MNMDIEVIFLGTGSSSSSPSIKCLINEKKNYECHCKEALENPNSRANRLNPSILIKSKSSI